MDKKIIAFVDGSPYAASTCDHAVWAAGRLNASVDLIHVLDRNSGAQSADLSGSIALGARTALMKELSDLDEQRAKLVAHRGRAILEDAEKILRDGAIEAVQTHLRQGDLIETLKDREGDANLVVIGKRGDEHDRAQGHLGSNLERVLRATQKPVLVASYGFSPISKICIAYDGGKSALKAMDVLSRSPIFVGLEVHIVTVGTETSFGRKGLEDAKAMLKAAGIEARVQMIAGDPETALGEFVEAENFDMVVMGAHGHSRIRSLIIGSTTTAMIRACRVPILLMR
ncbi:universal stress protein UspA [Thioclava sp. SK-1]|uniref:universal stress protein n=1 Tax=Thioclava sp. SK-1 TaxID=1889770 RepID=UPI0008270251|nr:universal stress protein [Thioclava sp. SK-1]OCX63414.1 universal stress protein UspA [Thioclava sp. SK-1]